MTAPAAATAAPPVLALRDVHVHLGGSHILQGISFEVPATGVTAVLGRNGVGKTTTMRAILGLVPSSGSITIDGRENGRTATHRLVQRGIGYVPEDREVFAGLTVTDNLKLAERDGRPRYDLVYELFPELRDRAHQSAGTLSGGQQQMLSLARALLNDNRLLIIDEPTKGLAPRVVTQVVEVLERAAAETPVVLVEQNLGAVHRLADQAVVLAEGRVVHSGPAAELLADQARTRELLGVAAPGRHG